MAKDPAFLFYSQDFYTGVSTMSMEDRGKFITILCVMHQKGRMTEETIRFLVGSISVNLKEKFLIDEKGFWYNERLEIEAEKRNKFVESRTLNGKSGGRPKANKNHKDNHKHTHIEDENENINENEKGEYKNPQKGFIPPSVTEVTDYFKANGYSFEAAIRAYNTYHVADWFDTNGKKVYNWKQKMHGVWFTEENKIKPGQQPLKLNKEYRD